MPILIARLCSLAFQSIISDVTGTVRPIQSVRTKSFCRDYMIDGCIEQSNVSSRPVKQHSKSVNIRCISAMDSRAVTTMHPSTVMPTDCAYRVNARAIRLKCSIVGRFDRARLNDCNCSFCSDMHQSPIEAAAVAATSW